MQKKVEGQQLIKVQVEDALYEIYGDIVRGMLFSHEQKYISEGYIKEIVYAIFTTNGVGFNWGGHDGCGLEYILAALISWTATGDEAKWRRRHSMVSNKKDGYLNPISCEKLMSTERKITIAEGIVYKKINKIQLESLQPIERIRLIDAILKDIEYRRAKQALEIYDDGCLDLSIAITCLIDWEHSDLGLKYWSDMYESACEFELEGGTL